MAQTRHSTLKEAFVKAFSNAKAALQSFLSGATWMDFKITFTRLFQVFSNVLANNTNNASENQKSLYYDIMHVDNTPESGLTPVGWSFFAGGIIFFFIGVGRRIYQNYRKITLSSYSYLERQLNKLSPSRKFSRSDIIQGFNDLRQRRKVVGSLEKSVQNAAIPDQAPQDQQDDIFKPSKFTRFIDLFNAKIHFFKKNKQNKTASIGAKLIGTVSLGVKKIWNFINNQAFAYWIVWLPFVLAFGIAAASTSIVIAPIILSITLGIGLAFGIWKTVDRVKQARKSEAEKETDKKEKAENQENARMVDELKMRYFMKKEHEINKALLAAHGANFLAEKVKRNLQETENVDDLSKTQIKLKKDCLYKENNQAGTQVSPTKDQVKKVLDSKLGKYLLAGSKRNLGISVAIEVVGGFVATAFVLWLFSAFAFVAAGTMATAAFAFLDSGLTTAIAGGVIGTFFGIKKIAEMRTKQLEFEKKVYETLSAPYKNEKNELNEPITKQKKFKQLEDKVESMKKQVEDSRLKRKEQLKGKSKAEIDNALVSSYDLKKVNVYNDYYFEKQKHQPSLWTRVKQGVNRAFTFIYGGQTGVFLIRALFLVGGIAVAACTGAPLIFLGIALAAGVIYGGVKLAQYHMERKRQHRENFVNSIDARISYLRKKEKELSALSKKLENDIKLEQNPDPAQQQPIHGNNLQDPPEEQQPLLEHNFHGRSNFCAATTKGMIATRKVPIDFIELPSQEKKLQQPLENSVLTAYQKHNMFASQKGQIKIPDCKFEAGENFISSPSVGTAA